MRQVVIDTNCLIQMISLHSPYRPIWNARSICRGAKEENIVKYDFPIQVRPQWPCLNKYLTLKFPVQGVNDGGLGRSRHLSAPL